MSDGRFRFSFPAGLLTACLLVTLGVPDRLAAQETDATRQSDAAGDAAGVDGDANTQNDSTTENQDAARPQEPAGTESAEQAGDAAEQAGDAGGGESEALKQYREDEKQWRAVLTDLRKLQARYQQADETEAQEIEAQWEQLLTKARELVRKLHDSAKNAYQESPNTDRQLTRFLVKLLEDEVRRDQYELASDLAQVLIENGCEDRRIYAAAGEAAFVLNEYDKAEAYLTTAQEAGVLADGSAGEKYLANVSDYRKFWEKEQEIREAEKKADDLPRVKLTTTEGDVVVELFENEAPETVGNFISLVGQGFYDDTAFHRVLPNFMAQGGSKNEGQGGPGYTIYCECYKDDHRKHFRGSLSMAHAGRDTGGSQFFLTFVPTSHLNGMHTVFGRVIEGMDVLAKLQRIDPDNPNPSVELDKIVKAEVLRKRDHEYVPHKVEE